MTDPTSPTDQLHLAIVTGSTRPGRKSLDVARWVERLAAGRDDLTTTIVDLADHPLPHLDEPSPPITGEYLHRSTRVWAEVIDPFDGFVFVTPEYNHSVPGVLKNAIDHLFAEWNDKVGGFVTYGPYGGVRAAEHLRAILGELKVADVRQQVVLSLQTDFVGYADFAPDPGHADTLAAMFAELVSWGRALRSVRAPALARER
jgi:NAD(P)H-dependent FMN reductase